MDVTVGRVVRARNGKVIHRDSFFTPYQLWNGQIEVGRDNWCYWGRRVSAKSVLVLTQRLNWIGCDTFLP